VVTWHDRPVDDQEPAGLDARRGATGEDATVRDWASPEALPVPDSDSAAERSASAAQSPSSTRVEQAVDQPVGSEDREAGPPVAVADSPDRAQGTTGAPTAAAVVPGSGGGPAPEPPAARVQPERRSVTRATGPPQRPSLLVQGLAPAALALALLAAAAAGVVPLAVGVLLLQVLLSLALLALLDAPAAKGALLVTLGTVLAADVVVLADDGRISRLAGVVALGLIASLVHQLVRTDRSRVTESLADTLIGIVVGCGAACLLALGQLDGGREVLLLGFAAAGAVLLVGRLGDRFAPSPVLAQGATRGWPGLVLGLVAGVLAALLVASLEVVDGQLPLRSAALLGLVVASTVATADLAVDLGAAELRAGWRDARRVAALRPTALLLPYALLGPVALLAGRLVLP
jgi:hypothetical protein